MRTGAFTCLIPHRTRMVPRLGLFNLLYRLLHFFALIRTLLFAAVLNPPPSMLRHTCLHRGWLLLSSSLPYIVYIFLRMYNLICELN